MEIFDTLVRRETRAINEENQGHVAHSWEVRIKANGVDYKAIKVDNVRTDRLYVTNYSDETVVTATFLLGDVEFNIIPYKDQLEVTLTRLNSTISPNASISHSSSTNRTYKAQLVEGGTSMSIGGDSPYGLSKGLANKQALKQISLQLIDPMVDRLRKQTFGTVFRNDKPIDAIRYILGEVAKPKSSLTESAIMGVDVVPGYREEPRSHIPLSHLTKLVEAPAVIDNIVGGIYPTGFAYYLQGNYWYCYPPYDLTRFSKAHKTLTIIKIPKFRMPGLEKTFRATRTQVIILTTRETKHTDYSEKSQLNEGNGVRFVDASKVMDGFSEKKGNKATIEMADHINEISLAKRRDKSDMVMSGDTIITEKYNKEFEKLAKREGSLIQTVWEYSNSNLLNPGMPIKYIFADGDDMKEVEGVLHAVEILSYPTNVNIASQRFVEMTLLTLFIPRDNPIVGKRIDIGSTTAV